MEKPKVLKSPRGIASSSITSFGSFMIPKPILRTKGRALRAQLVLYLLEIVFTISAVLGEWLIFVLASHNTTQSFYMTSAFLSPSTNPNTPNAVVKVVVVPMPSQGCAYSAIGFASAGFILTLVATYSSKVPERLIKYIFGACSLFAIAIFFVEIAAQAGFEANLDQLATVVSLTGSTSGVDYSGRGYGYASLVISWILAIPLFILSNTVFFGHLRGAWEHGWRETLRASWGQGVPDWLQQTINAANSPAVSSSASPAVPVSGDQALAISPLKLTVDA